MNKTKWGILGCGNIARKFANSLQSLEDAELAACASRTPGKAAAFAEAHGAGQAFQSYEELLTQDVDAVYVATTHNFHYENVMLALAHGKAVLCEKPLGVCAEESRKMAAEAEAKGLFLMEGMWTRFLPAVRQMKTWLDAGEIGDAKMLQACFSINKPFDPEHRLYNPDLAGGALLDAGIYPVSMASYLMGGAPERISVLATMTSTGVDETTLMNFAYGNGRLAQLRCGIHTASENRLELAGSEGRIVLPEQFQRARDVELHRFDGRVERLHLPFPEPEGFRFEILAVQEALRAGRTQCAEMPWAESVALAETMDRIMKEFHA